MLGIIFSLDYEVYGSGAGDFNELMLRPSTRLLEVLESRGAKLTIMAEVAEIMALQRYEETLDLHQQIKNQLQGALKNGHDVQLHLHPAWFNAKLDEGRWKLDFSEYALVNLSPDKIHRYLEMGKNWLEESLKPIVPTYKCTTFRAGNWLIQPSEKVVGSLESLDFLIDSSVFYGGYESTGDYELDYRNVPHHLHGWKVDKNDITKEAKRNGLTEIPIYSKMVPITSMLTPRRILMQRKLSKGAQEGYDGGKAELGAGKKGGVSKFMRPKKFDFCRLGFSEMKKVVKDAMKEATRTEEKIVPLVAIGHSTEFLDDGVLERFVDYVNKEYVGEVCWSTFNEVADSLGN